MVCIWNKQQIIKSSLHARCLSELAPAIQQNLHSGQPCIFRRHLVQMSFSKSKVGLFSVKIFKAILHSLYPFIILSNTGNIDSSLPSVDSPIAGNKRQNSHWHRMSVQFLQLQWREKISVIVNSLYSSEWVAGTLSSTAEPRLLQSWRTCVYFRHCCFFYLGWVSVPRQAAHMLCWEGLRTQLGDHVDCQVSWNVNFPMFCENSCDWIHPTPFLYAGFGEPLNVE